jgi:uncharacterized membrane-anchored protein
MKCLYGAVHLSLLMLAIALPTMGEGKEPSTSAAGAITEAPVSSSTPAASASATSASTSVAASAATPATTEASASASAANAVNATSAPNLASAASASAASSAPGTPALPNLNWKIGPREITLLDQATVKIPQDFAYLEQDDARQLLRKLGNPNADDVIGLFTGPGGNWLFVVRFNKSGFIKDGEEPEWNPDELLDALKKNIGQTNAIRKKNGVNETEIVGWIEKPNYDVKRHRLIWGVSSRDKGAKDSDFQSVNFNVYTLGKEGYFNFNLVTDLAQLEQNKKYASMLASSIVFKDGKKYRDFKKGTDKLSTYTVTGLVAGNESAVGEDKKEQEPGKADSKLARFVKVFGLILLGILGLPGATYGVYYFIRKRRAAKAMMEEAETEAPPDK